MKNSQSVIKLLHIFALCSFAISQPLFSLISSDATFLVAHDLSGLEILILVLLLALIAPLAFFAAFQLVRLFLPAAAEYFFLAIVAVLLSLFILPIVKDIPLDSPGIPLAIAIIAAIGITVIYNRYPVIKNYLTILSVAAIFFPLWFLFGTQVTTLLFEADDSGSDIESIGGNNGTPIVFVIFDEIPLSSLMNTAHEIDANKYPNFADFASTSHWYRNASTVSYFTNIAVSAILSGNFPEFIINNEGQREVALPTSTSYPRNIFSLVENTHEITAIESITNFAPARAESNSENALLPVSKNIILWADTGIVYLNIILPQNLIPNLPGLEKQWADFLNLAGRFSSSTSQDQERFGGGRANRVDDFIDAIENSDSPQLYFLHTMLPHSTFVYLPSGKYYGTQEMLPHGMGASRWSSDPWEATQGYQRHLLQLGFVDSLLGEIIARLKAEQLFDESIVIVVGDHGESFRESTSPRGISNSNVQDTLLVPLFIKLPNQSAGEVSDRNVENIDILPTVAELIESENSWDFDGQSLITAEQEKSEKTVYYHTGEILTFPSRIDALEDSLLRKSELFGEGDLEELLMAVPDSNPLFKDLLFQELGSVEIINEAPLPVKVENSFAFRFIDTNSNFIPAHLRGSFPGNNLAFPLEIAVVLNGSVVAVTRTFENENSAENFTAMLPEAVFLDGINTLGIYLVLERNGELVLHETQLDNSDVLYELGKELSFAADSFETQYVVRGLGRPKESWSWSNEQSVLFVFGVSEPGSDLLLTANLFPFLSDRVPVQNVNIRVNDIPAGSWSLNESGASEQTLIIPEELIAGDSIIIVEFQLPDAAIPGELGVNEDNRLLGVAFISMTITANE